jgi:hypothetical protein
MGTVHATAVHGDVRLEALSRFAQNSLLVDVSVFRGNDTVGLVTIRCFKVCPSYEKLAGLSSEEIADRALADF